MMLIAENGTTRAATPEEEAEIAAYQAAELARAAASVPAVVSMAQARIALIRAGKFDSVDAAVNATGVNSETWTWWHYATIVERANPVVAQLGGAIGLSGTDIDALFRTASTIT